MFTTADLPASFKVRNGKINLKPFETILKYSLIQNVGSKSGNPPTNSVDQDYMEGSIRFDSPNNEIRDLFHQSKQQKFDRLYTWQR